MREKLEQAARYVKCPFCEVKVRVPARDEIFVAKVRTVAENVRDVGEYALGAPVEKPAMPPTKFFEARAEIKSVELEAPPDLAFFSGVFNFPWRSDVLLRWGFMTAGFLVVFLVAAVAASVARGMSGPQGGVLAFFALPLIWLTWWAVSHASACCLRVIVDTAAGVDRIESWPEPNWREWTGQMMYVAYLVIVSGFAGYSVGLLMKVAGNEGSIWWPMLGTVFVLFPVLLLSALEANSLFLPFSLPILQSLGLLWWGWLLCYVMFSMLAAVLAGIAWLSFAVHPFLGAMLAGPAFAAILLIASRLLGRLAWRASHEPEPQKTRKTRK